MATASNRSKGVVKVAEAVLHKEQKLNLGINLRTCALCASTESAMGLNVRYCYTSWATARGVGQPEERTISILQALCGLMPRSKELFVMLLI